MSKNEERTINNQVSISGRVASKLEFSHEFSNGTSKKRFYIFKLACKRLNDTYDLIPVMVSEEYECFNQLTEGKYVYIEGNFRSYNKQEEDKIRLILYVYPRRINFLNEDEILSNDCDTIIMEGFVCKEVIYRKTPLKRKITDLLIAVNRPYGKTDYIPCIAWEEDAIKASNFKVGEKVKIAGRIQSREYNKILEKGKVEVRTAYEVSCRKIEKV